MVNSTVSCDIWVELGSLVCLAENMGLEGTFVSG